MAKIAFQGERGAYSELAAREFFGKKMSPVSVAEFGDVFKNVASGTADFGVVPIENSQAGSIHQNYDALLEYNLSIIGEILLKVSHCLIVNKGVTRRQIKNIYSHPQALLQCRHYLEKMKGVAVEPVSNTATAVKKIAVEKLMDAAAIASEQAADAFDMQVLSRNIEDNKDNFTRFIILGPAPVRKIKNSPVKTSIVFSTKNIPGALFKALSVFALRDINLYKIESRPMHARRFEYLFYLDFSGDAQDEAQKNAIVHLQEITTFYRLLGSYPVGREAHPAAVHTKK
jgi:prephenate dehydratase